MEALNPNDISNLDFDTISFITLKNGDMIVIDSSVPQKYKSDSHKYNYNCDFTKNRATKQKLSVSKQLNFFYKGRKYFNNNNKIIIKNDFNLVSKLSKNISLFFKGKSNKLILNNIPNSSIKENINKNTLFETNYNNYNNKEKTINKQEVNTNININSDINENELNKMNNITSKDNTPINNINNLNIKTEEITEEEKLDMRIKRKSRNYLERLSLVFGERNKPLVNAVISLKIPSDVNKELSPTEKEFDMMVSQLKQKRSKYQINRNDHCIYHRYYELYKDNNKEYKYVNLNRIKYYQESENDNKENEQEPNNKENINKFDNNLNINNTFYGSFNRKGMNKSMVGITDSNIINKTMSSFYQDNTRTIKENKSFSNRIKEFGYNPTLVCPTNNFKGNLDSDI